MSIPSTNSAYHPTHLSFIGNCMVAPAPLALRAVHCYTSNMKTLLDLFLGIVMLPFFVVEEIMKPGKKKE